MTENGEITIKVDEITNLIRRQFNLVINNNQEAYEGYKVTVSSEQMFDIRDLEKKEIAVIVSLLPASMLFSQIALPIFIETLSEHNGASVCQKLLLEYAETYDKTGTTTRQLYNSPSMGSYFNEVYDGYRSTFTLSGTFLINENSNTFSIKYNDEVVYSINNTISFDPKINGTVVGDRTSSRVEYSTTSLNLIMPLNDNVDFTNDLLDVLCGISSVDTEFILNIEFASGKSLINTSYRIANISIQQAIESFPILTVSFTN